LASKFLQRCSPPPTINKLLEVLEGERVKPNADDAISRIASALGIQITIEEPKPAAAGDFRDCFAPLTFRRLASLPGCCDLLIYISSWG
jgi:hypothetical protein